MSPITKKSTRSNAALITPSNTLDEAMNTAKTTRGAIKDVKEAKKLLVKEGWTVEGETITLETIARLLLAHSLNAKVNPETANILTAAAYLITLNLQEGIAHGVAQSIAELLKHSITLMTVDVCENLEHHANKLAETAQSQAAIAESMQKTQENMEESAKQAATQAKSYSQITSTPPFPPQPTSTPPVTHSQLQIHNREQIKKRQVLINFEKTEELQLEMMNEKTLLRKATDALLTCYAIATDSRPSEAKIKSGTLLRNGGLLLTGCTEPFLW